MDVQVTLVDIPTADGTADALLATPVENAPHPGVLLYPDAFGLRPRIHDMASRLAGAGYAVLVPNVFYRSGRAADLGVGDLAGAENRAAMFDRLRPLMQALTPDVAMRDADAYLAFLAGDDRVAHGPVGTLGYCMGGALALRTAAHAPERVAAVASFHGGRLATDEPDSPHLLAPRIAAEVYLAHADNDASMPPDQQERLEAALAAAGVRYRAELYAGALHGFTMADAAVYDEVATERHWERLVDLLGRTLH